MKIDKVVSGFCPTLNSENSIKLTYEIVEKSGKAPEYIQVGADCEHSSYGLCPIMLECPIRAKAPKVINNG